MMRSESRTDDTSGLVTMIAASACRMASVAPRSIPAGLSQMIQSNFVRSSAMTSATPLSVSASLSRVCEAGSRQRFSSRLSRMSACVSLATPWMTLIRSKTTRRSAPSTRSRFRRPTSKSTTTTLSPPRASAAPSAAVEVVLPTPPLPDVTTKTWPMSLPFVVLDVLILVKGGNFQRFAFEPGLDRPAAQAVLDVVSGLVVGVDGEQLGLDALAENAGAGIAVGAGHRPAAQCAVDVDRTSGHDLGARSDRAKHGHVAVDEHDRLSRAHWSLDQERRRLSPRRGIDDKGRRLGQIGRRLLRTAAAAQDRWQPWFLDGGIDTGDAEHADFALRQVLDEMHDRGCAQIDRRQIERHRLLRLGAILIG